MTGIEDEAQVRPFAAVLREMDRGKVHDELSTGLHELIAAIQDTGKKGKLTLTVEVKPLKPGQTDTLEAVATVAIAPPKGDPPATVFFTDQTGNLTREDPDRENQLPLREIAGGKEQAA